MLPILWATGCVPVLESPDGGVKEPWVAPENGWHVGTPPADLEAEGFDAGDVIPDGTATDQFGDTVSYWQFYGVVWVLDVSTMWCSPCQELAAGVQETADSFQGQGAGFAYVTLLAQDVEGEVPDRSDLEEWAEYYGIEEPVLSDGTGYSSQVVVGDAFPAVLVIDDELTVHARVSPPTDEAVRAAVEEIL